ncbi:MAG: 50S ribosomal protein L7/L12 [Candidatus Babeliales bacterium]
MSAKSHEKLIEEIGNMSVLELSDLVKALEEKFDVKATMSMAAAPAAAAAAPAAAQAEEKAEYKVTLKDAGSDKMKVIKLVKQYSGLGLQESKAAVDNAPSVIVEKAAKDKANEIKQKLEEVGAKVELA